MDDFNQSLACFQVPLAEQAELVAIIESTKDGIIVLALQSGPPTG